MWMVRWLRIFTTVQHRHEVRRWFFKKGRNAVWLSPTEKDNAHGYRRGINVC